MHSDCSASRFGLVTITVLCLLTFCATPHVWAQATLESPQPGSAQSGIGVISGWACDAQAIGISFNGGPRFQAGSGTLRADTAGVCGDTDNGFGLLFNWNLLGDGIHTVQAFADGVEFAKVLVIVTVPGEEFLRGAGDEVSAVDFPAPGETHTLRWQEAQQNFVITDGSSVSGAGGTSGGGAADFREPAAGFGPKRYWGNLRVGVRCPDD